MIRDEEKTKEAGKLLFESGVYTNPILCSAVPRKQTRIIISLLATHTKEHLDKALNALEYIDKKLHIIKK